MKTAIPLYCFRPLKGILFLFVANVSAITQEPLTGFRPLKGILFLFAKYNEDQSKLVFFEFPSPQGDSFFIRKKALKSNQFHYDESFRPLKGILFLFPISRTTDTKAFYKPSIGGVRDWNFLTYSILYKTVMIRFLIISAENIGKL